MIPIQRVDFTTATANVDLMQLAVVKAQIQKVLGLSTNSDYTARFTANPVTGEKLGIRMSFDIVMTANNTVKINAGLVQNLTKDIIYSSENATDINALIIGSAGTGTISMDILR